MHTQFLEPQVKEIRSTYANCISDLPRPARDIKRERERLRKRKNDILIILIIRKRRKITGFFLSPIGVWLRPDRCAIFDVWFVNGFRNDFLDENRFFDIFHIFHRRRRKINVMYFWSVEVTSFVTESKK